MESKFDLIERYLSDDMSVKEQAEFEDLLRQDPELMKEFLFRRKINEAILEEEVMNLRESLSNLMEDPKYKSIFLLRNKFVLSSIAAVLIAFIVVASIYFFPAGKIDGNQLFLSYYTPYPTVICSRAPENKECKESLLFKALQAYNQKDYQLTSAFLIDLLSKDADNKMAMFYLANCEIEMGNYAESVQHLNKLVKENSHIFWEQSHWYLALVYIQLKDYDSAKIMLNKIVKQDFANKEEAKAILEKIN